MTIQLYFAWDEQLINVVDKSVKFYKKTFFFLGFIGVLFISIILSPILYLLFLGLLRKALNSFKKDVETLSIEITEKNYKKIKEEYDSTSKLISLLDEIKPTSNKIPFLLKPIVKTLMLFKNTLIELQHKLEIVENYLEEQQIFISEISDFKKISQKHNQKYVNRKPKQAIVRFLENEEPFILE